MFQRIVSAFVAGLALASAYTTPVGDPTGNPILTPGLNQIVPVGTPFQVTWNPTTQGTVSLVLLRGPSTNVQPLYAIANSIQNTGSYSWTPSTDLDDDVTHYGLELIVDATGQYQYSTQFGISNPAKKAGSSSSMSMSMSSSSASARMSMSSASVSSVSASVSSVISSISSMASMSSIVSSSAAVSTLVSTVIAGNGSYIQPTVTSVLGGTQPSASPTTSARTSSSSAVLSNDAASKAVISFGGAAAMVLAAVAAY